MAQNQNNQNNQEDDEIEIQHRLLIQEEDVDQSQLPKEMKDRIRKFNLKLEEYEKSGDADLFFELQQDDIAIADDIQTLIEDEEVEEEEEEEEEENQDNVTQAKVQTKPAQQQQQNATPPVAELTAEERVLNAMAGGNVISVSDLERILNREPDYPNEQVGNLKLRKQYLKPFYEKA